MNDALLVVEGLALLVGSALAGRAFLVLARRMASGIEGAGRALERLAVSDELDWTKRVRDLEDHVERLPKRWAQFRDEAKRAEDRARHAIRRTREELQEHGLESGRIEASAADLQVVDGNGSEGSPVPAVPESVESHQAAPEDWRKAALRRKFSGH